MNTKWLATTEIFDEYERRFAAARVEKELTRPWEPAAREQIIQRTKKMLGWKDELVPEIRDMEEIAREDCGSYSAIQYRFRSWDRCYTAATLYLPHTEEKVPLVFVCCGHGGSGRLTGSYIAMGHRLAQLGMAALVMDNIGQGDRNCHDPSNFKNPDHWWSVAPFYCGLTLQGMIVMETVAMIRFMAKDPRFDSERLGACGNSGGGTLTLFLAAMAPELKVLSSSGYPSEVSYVMGKERPHCACNLLLGSSFAPEMWEIYSTFAPKPLLLEGGEDDNLIPQDLAYRNARKVRNSYVQLDADEQFEFSLTPTRHSWVVEDVNLISSFLSRNLLGVTPEDAQQLDIPQDISPYRVPMPADMLTTEELAQALTGKTMPQGTRLCDIFVPTFHSQPICEADIQTDVGRGDMLMRVFAQFECALLNSEQKER